MASINSSENVTLSSGTASLTVPSGVNACLVFASYYANSDVGYTSVTLASGAADVSINIAQNTPNAHAHAGFIWWNPSSGSQTLAMTENDLLFGSTITAVYIDDVETTGVRASGEDVNSGSNQATVTLTGLTSGDLVIKGNANYNAAPSLSTGWTNINTQVNNSWHHRISYIEATGTSQVCDGEDASEPSVTAFAFIPASGGGGSILPLLNAYYS